jgi:hypothetical protein
MTTPDSAPQSYEICGTDITDPASWPALSDLIGSLSAHPATVVPLLDYVTERLNGFAAANPQAALECLHTLSRDTEPEVREAAGMAALHDLTSQPPQLPTPQTADIIAAVIRQAPQVGSLLFATVEGEVIEKGREWNAGLEPLAIIIDAFAARRRAAGPEEPAQS